MTTADAAFAQPLRPARGVPGVCTEGLIGRQQTRRVKVRLRPSI